MKFKTESQLLQELLESGELDSLSVQVITLNRFANSIGYTAVDNDPRRGFVATAFHNQNYFVLPKFISLEYMQSCYNHGYLNVRTSRLKIPRVTGYKVLERVSLQYNKRTSKKLTSELYWLKFVKED